MTTEEPDGPMPLCMSPESYRAEITRRKAAERERDDLAKQAERLIEENEKLTANVATLVEQLGEAREDERHICVEHDERLSEVAMLRSLLADTAKALGKDGALIVAVPSIAREVVEQLGEAERERNVARNREIVRCAELERHIAKLEARGAAQPVVEPRDERPCFEGGDLETLLRVVTCAVAYLRTTTTRAGMILPDALSDEEVRDAEGLLATMRRHLGYAPHPSGTEGPLRKLLQDTKQRILRTASRTVPEYAHSQWLEITDDIDAALAASPPDGTAPERARPCNHCGAMPYQEAFPSGKEPPVVRGALDAQADAEHRLFAIRESIAAWVSEHWHLKKVELLEGIRRAPIDATRPPDGMPGEPASKGPWIIPTASAEYALIAAGMLPPRGESPAAPPTVPGEPPRTPRGQHRWCVNCETWKEPTPETPPFGCPDCGHETTNIIALREAVASFEPAPPLTPERAPVDDAAVRADERERVGRYLRHQQREYEAKGIGVHGATLHILADMIEMNCIEVPRRSEGAG